MKWFRQKPWETNHISFTSNKSYNRTKDHFSPVVSNCTTGNAFEYTKEQEDLLVEFFKGEDTSKRAYNAYLKKHGILKFRQRYRLCLDSFKLNNNRKYTERFPSEVVDYITRKHMLYSTSFERCKERVGRKNMPHCGMFTIHILLQVKEYRQYIPFLDMPVLRKTCESIMDILRTLEEDLVQFKYLEEYSTEFPIECFYDSKDRSRPINLEELEDFLACPELL